MVRSLSGKGGTQKKENDILSEFGAISARVEEMKVMLGSD